MQRHIYFIRPVQTLTVSQTAFRFPDYAHATVMPAETPNIVPHNGLFYVRSASGSVHNATCCLVYINGVQVDHMHSTYSEASSGWSSGWLVKKGDIVWLRASNTPQYSCWDCKVYIAPLTR